MEGSPRQFLILFSFLFLWLRLLCAISDKDDNYHVIAVRQNINHWFAVLSTNIWREGAEPSPGFKMAEQNGGQLLSRVQRS